jgi:alpha-galactosidase
MGRRLRATALPAVLVAVCALLTTNVRLRGDAPLLQVDTAFITRDANARGWVIGNDLIHYSFGLQASAIGVRSIIDPVTGRDWHLMNTPDSSVVVNGQQISVGSAATVFERSGVTEWWGGVRLDVVYKIAAAGLEVTRSYACYPGSAVIETWTTFRSDGSRSATLSGLSNFSIAIKDGAVRWIKGLQVPAEEGGAFTLSSVDVGDGQTFQIGSDTRSSETNIPWASVLASDVSADDPSAWAPEFFGAILWGGSWRITAKREAALLTMQVGLPAFDTLLPAGASLEMPHAIFGFTNPVVPAVSLALRSFIDMGVRHGRALRADVTYNTWFTYGTFVDEPSMRAEMEFAASMGIEQFVVDAGWWVNINTDDPSDFTRGLGSWQVDPDRFPSGLGALTDYAHQLGMRFGVWVEPERVDLSTVGQPDMAEERFLATQSGRYVPGSSNSDAQYAQICLASPAARDWLVSKLHQFLDDVRPDYLKWDNNFWINCDRGTHGHGAQDGNFAHTQGLETVLSDLRGSYPDMDIENCASGGNRLSLGMLGTSDAGWIDDHSWPSVHVRHNLGGLLTIFPAAYLFTFAMGDATEDFDDSPAADLLTLMRSRMSGMLGGTWRAASMSEGTRTAVAGQVALYKGIRPIIQHGAGILLGPQVMSYPDAPWWGWDAIEHVSTDTRDAVVIAFDTDDSAENAIVKPRALNPAVFYQVESADYGNLGTVGGADLMENGVELLPSGLTHSHVLIFRVQPGQTPARPRGR